ncbi:sigma-70 family RNA polymerase sigma factor [Gracilibacillus oryzae]|uniref:Sigma-70 family RNA polymerase sigma factor n=1 Tax=Gracilibacillus oryzae TaxID=1672701 RepID=A0A7C8GRW7_9BACI|nr:sigma-70 family RNA polymerase sigma factor [Gracilibacillus oryzae]KAB8129175.1 sigma-70 family RNA polymerase sigma factor [Gracilibacillus oryzae]
MQFEEVLKDHERVIHHLINKYGIRDMEGEFFQEGMIAIWEALRTFDQSKSKLSTYIYSCVSRRFLNKIKKESREQDNLDSWLERVRIDDLLMEDKPAFDRQLLSDIREKLSDKQWCWFVHAVIKDQTISEIADTYAVTAPAVKSWRRSAKSKIRQLLQQNHME